MYLLTDKNIAGGINAMKAARLCIEFFSKSTQATEKLRNFLEVTILPQYAGKKVIKLLQDVHTR